MFEGIIDEMSTLFQKSAFSCKTTFYFSVDEVNVTVTIDAEGYLVEQGKTVEAPDCLCTTTADMFKKIWYDGYRPGIMDFFGGTIKTNDPLMLQQFIRAFGK